MTRQGVVGRESNKTTLERRRPTGKPKIERVSFGSKPLRVLSQKFLVLLKGKGKLGRVVERPENH